MPISLSLREQQVLDDVFKRLTENYGYTENALVTPLGTLLGALVAPPVVPDPSGLPDHKVLTSSGGAWVADDPSGGGTKPLLLLPLYAIIPDVDGNVSVPGVLTTDTIQCEFWQVFDVGGGAMVGNPFEIEAGLGTTVSCLSDGFLTFSGVPGISNIGIHVNRVRSL